MIRKLSAKTKLPLFLVPVILVTTVSLYSVLGGVVTPTSASQPGDLLNRLQQPALLLQQRLGVIPINNDTPTQTTLPGLNAIGYPVMNSPEATQSPTPEDSVAQVTSIPDLTPEATAVPVDIVVTESTPEDKDQYAPTEPVSDDDNEDDCQDDCNQDDDCMDDCNEDDEDENRDKRDGD
jgi:hypothetical protein